MSPYVLYRAWIRLWLIALAMLALVLAGLKLDFAMTEVVRQTLPYPEVTVPAYVLPSLPVAGATPPWLGSVIVSPG
jgi:hypothetical protein